MSSVDFAVVTAADVSPEKQVAIDTFLEYLFSDGARYFIEVSNAPSAVTGIKPDTSSYSLLLPYFESGRIFGMPSNCRWTDATYSDYTAALQNLVLTGEKKTFYEEFNDALTDYGMPAVYIH